MIYQRKTNRGFTLIELLVVIAIIALLASIVMANLNKAKSKARDAYRLDSLKQVQTALALYYAKYDYYPPSTPHLWRGDNYWTSNPMPAGWLTGYIPGLVPEIMSALPIDPKPTTGPPVGNGFHYQARPTNGPAKHYKFRIYQTLENPPAVPSSSSFYDPARSGDVWMVVDKYDLPPLTTLPAYGALPANPNPTARDICLYMNTSGSGNTLNNDDYPICY